MIKLILLFTLLSIPAYAGEYVAGSGEPVSVTVTADIVGDANVFEITEDTIADCEDSTDPQCSLLIVEENDEDSVNTE